ncbi:SDR family oxidoreductase [Aquidulcibacter paucihalophilus]|uniref:SDR family oxidoreductase n=1 Tax=Aquidulcibacter paucihalophilus TaxID=1978549 RepID=UPI000A199406|nr:aldehyde reductase [Aquidulcibacter paucihalophilus]
MMVERVLVSGANGFIASHSIAQLLEQGKQVVGTVRNPKDAARTAHVRALKGAAERLTLVAADLTAADPFSAFMDVDAVLHMASPYVLTVQDAQKDLVDPAVQGTVSMLQAAAKSPRVKRVVLTSSMAAITDEPDGRSLTEADWNEKSSLTRNAYYYSKTMAERAAWDFMEREKPSFDLIVINPFMVIGPALSSEVNTSNQILVDVAKGVYPAILALEWGFVDVRDVADAHVRALSAPGAKGRYICAAGNRNMAQVVALIRKAGAASGKLPSLNLAHGLGTGLMTLASYAQPAGVGSYLRTHLGRVPRFSHAKIQADLGLTFRDVDQTIIDTVQDLIRLGHMPAA